jgi:hypothetical protein
MGGSSSKNVSVNKINKDVTDIFTSVSLTCTSEAKSNQQIDLTCNLEASRLPGEEPYENNLACQTAIRDLGESMSQKYDHIRKTWEKGPADISLPIDQDFQSVSTQMIARGKLCKACVFQNIGQQTVMKSTTNCKSLNNIKNVLTQKVADKVKQSLTNNTDFLAPLAQMLGASDTQSIVSNITDRITTKITTTVISDIVNSIHTTQSITLNATSKAVTQYSASSAVSNYLTQNKVFNTVFSDDEWETLQRLYNSQNTINSLGNTVVGEVTVFSKMFKSILGKIVIFMIVVTISVAAIIFIALIVRGFIKLNKKQSQKEVLEKQQIESGGGTAW